MQPNVHNTPGSAPSNAAQIQTSHAPNIQNPISETVARPALMMRMSGVDRQVRNLRSTISELNSDIRRHQKALDSISTDMEALDDNAHNMTSGEYNKAAKSLQRQHDAASRNINNCLIDLRNAQEELNDIFDRR
jgi:predicted  nucleic acid-binding Zn-ribbon protein